MSETDLKPAPAGLYTQADICTRGRFSKSHLYNLIGRGHFPQPALKCGIRFTRWSALQVDAWFDNPRAWIAAHAAQEPEEAA